MEKVTVPEGKSGDWEVTIFEVTESQSRMSLLRDGRRCVYPGKYTKLTHFGDIVMSDTNAEMRDHYKPVAMANGNILINGLGLGVVLLNCLIKGSVSHATVVEKSKDVIDLVALHYIEMFGNKLTIINDDALTWKAPVGEVYGMVWHDIWPCICADNLEEMKKLHRKYGRRCDWQGSWCRAECEYIL